MNATRSLTVATLCLVLTTPAFAWHGPGHELAARTAVVALGNELPAFFGDGGDLIAHCARDPDLFTRPIASPALHAAEAPEHYFDVEPVQDVALPGDRWGFLELLFQRGLKPSQVGLLPYAIAEWTERLRIAFAEHRKRPEDPNVRRKCLVYAGLLAHYGADLTMPLHTTIHYDGRTKLGEKSPRTGIHPRADALIQKLPLSPQQAAEGVDPKALGDLLPAILAEFAKSHALVDRVYELDARIPKLDDPLPEDAELRQFATERLKAAGGFVASLCLTAWRDSAKIELPDWHQRPAAAASQPAGRQGPSGPQGWMPGNARISAVDLLPILRHRKTQRVSSFDVSGRNADFWRVPPGETRLLADIEGPGVITHIWMTQRDHYRECLLKITWDDAEHPSVLVPLGDFFGLGHGIVNSYQSALFTASTAKSTQNKFNEGCAINCYVPMPFRRRARVELVNQSRESHAQYFYIDYETLETPPGEDLGYFHAEFRRANPFGGWGHEIRVNSAQSNIVNKERTAWDNNYVILETKGRGHYIGCNLSVTNFQGTWWGEGDDMIWVDGYKWPPDLHGTGSEDYLNQAWGMQPNAFARNGSSIHESNTGGYQTSYIHHLENPVRFTKEIKVTIEHGHGNHLRNEMSSVAYWYAEKPTKAATPPPVAQRMPVLRDSQGRWTFDESSRTTPFEIEINPEMEKKKAEWKKLQEQEK